MTDGQRILYRDSAMCTITRWSFQGSMSIGLTRSTDGRSQDANTGI